MKYIANKNIKHRREQNGYILYDILTRNLVFLSAELFDVWENIENVDSYKNKISTESYENIIQTFISQNLIAEGV